jgi:LPXTG-motif cell wall-anchored protein
MRKFGASLVVLFASLAFVSGTVAVSATAAGAATGSDPTVTIQSTGCGGALFCFSPASITVTDGSTVTWVNASGVQHTVTRCASGPCSGTSGGTGSDGSFMNGAIGVANGASFSHTFHGAGTYNYYCTIHGFGVMHGTVTVVAATTATTTSPATAPPAAASGGASTSNTTQPATAAAAATSSSNLPHTGSDPQLLLWIAAIVLAIGVLAATASRRRSRARA